MYIRYYCFAPNDKKGILFFMNEGVATVPFITTPPEEPGKALSQMLHLQGFYPRRIRGQIGFINVDADHVVEWAFLCDTVNFRDSPAARFLTLAELQKQHYDIPVFARRALIDAYSMQEPPSFTYWSEVHRDFPAYVRQPGFAIVDDYVIESDDLGARTWRRLSDECLP